MAHGKRVGFFGWLRRLLGLAVLAALVFGGFWIYRTTHEAEVLKEIIDHLTTDTRVADVWVESIKPSESAGPEIIRLKILQYDSQDKALAPIFCNFSLNDVIHFEALVVRLDDEMIKGGKGKSVHLFRRAYALDDDGNTYESCSLSAPMAVPGAYRLNSMDERTAEIERKYWRAFWELALDEKRRERAGVKNAQIEAPATKFKPDLIYRIFLESDGGIYIQAKPVPEILKGEHVKIKNVQHPR
jgi:hypothetical protein